MGTPSAFSFYFRSGNCMQATSQGDQSEPSIRSTSTLHLHFPKSSTNSTRPITKTIPPKSLPYLQRRHRPTSSYCLETPAYLA